MNFRELPQECEDRAYWHKRFNFAAWLFLLMSFYFIFASETAWSALLAIATSFGFRVVDAVCATRHALWHFKNDVEGKHDV